MSDLPQPLLHPAPGDPKTADQSNEKTLINKISKIRDSLFEKFKPKPYEFGDNCEMVLLNQTNNHLVGLQKSKTIEILEIPSNQIHTKVLKVNSEIKSIKFDKNGNFLFVATVEGKIFRYDYPELSDHSRTEISFERNKEIIFDVSNDGIVFAGVNPTGLLYRLNFNKVEKKIVARCSEYISVNVPWNGGSIGVVTKRFVIVFSRKHNWKQFQYKIKSAQVEEGRKREERNVLIEFTKDARKIFIVYKEFIELWDIFKGKIEKCILFPENTKITSVKMCLHYEYLVCVDNESKITIWSSEVENQGINENDLTESQMKYIEKNFGDDISNLKVDTVPKFLNSLPNIKSEKETPDYYLQIDEKNRLIYSHKIKSKEVHGWDSIFTDIDKINHGFEKVSHLLYSEPNIIVISGHHAHFLNETGEKLKCLHLKQELKVSEDSQNSPNSIYAACLDMKDKNKLYLSGNGAIILVNLENFKVEKRINIKEIPIIQALASNGEVLACAGSHYEVLIFDSEFSVMEKISPKANNTIDDGKKDQNKEKTKQDVDLLSFIKNYLVVGKKNGEIFVYSKTPENLPSKYTLAFEKHDHISSIKSICILANHKTIITIGKDRKCNFYSYQKQEMAKLRTQEIDSIVDSCIVSEDENNCVIGTVDGLVTVYNLPGFERVYEYHFKDVNQGKLVYSPTSYYLFISNSSGVYKMLSPLSTGHYFIISESVDIPNLNEFIGSHGRTKLFDQNLIIAPDMINILHFHAYYNSNEDLVEAIKSNVMYLNSSLGYPIHLAINCHNYDACEAILAELIKMIKVRPSIFMHIEEDLIDLNQAGLVALTEFYSCVLIEQPEEPINDICSSSLSLPIVKYNFSNILKKSDFYNQNQNSLQSQQNPLENQKVNFQVSAIRIYFELGSTKSIQFLESLKNCSNDEIFRTKFIKTILLDKWDQIMWVIIIYQIVFSIYLILFSFYLIARDPTSLLLCSIFNVILTLYDFYQLVANLLRNNKDIMNLVDVLRATFFFLYIFYVYSSLEYKSEKQVTDAFKLETNGILWMLMVITILSWVRGLTIFLLHHDTRYMISLLLKVLIDVIPFASIVLYSVVSFAFIKLSLFGDAIEFNSLENLSKLMHLVFLSYFDALGNFNPDSENFIEQILIIVNTIFNVIIMMNLLISILSSSYDSVNSKAEVEDLKQLIGMILEAEYLMVCNRELENMKFLQLCEKRQEKESSKKDSITELSLIRQEIANLKNMHHSSNEVSNRLAETHIESQKKFEKIKKNIISEMLINSENIKKKIENQALIKGNDKDIAQNFFECLNGHPIFKCDSDSTQACDICKKEDKSKEIYLCRPCNFYKCAECAKFISDKSMEESKLTCLQNHKMLTINNGAEYFKKYDYVKQQCRFCNNDVKNKILHCILCMYSICLPCKMDIEKYFNMKKKGSCNSNHRLHWRTGELYKDKQSLVYKCINCSNDKTSDPYRVGSGAFYCFECNEYWCLGCFMKIRVVFKKTEQELKIIELEREKGKEDSEGEHFEYEYEETPKVSSKENEDQDEKDSEQ